LDISRKILNSCNDSLGEVGKLSVVDLLKFNLTAAMSIRILTAFEVGNRRIATDTIAREKIKTSRTAYEIFRSVLNDKPYEEFWIIMLNKANMVLRKCKISEGGISGTVVDPKKIFKVALDYHASSIILGHNHPSGFVVPSDADIKITKKLVDAGKLLEIAVLDHLIIADDTYYSFSDDGAL
jgi:DNA repair protein RadC